MTRRLTTLTVAACLCLSGSASLGQGRTQATQVTLPQFEGRWKNVDLQTAGLTTIDISVRRDKLMVRAWGKCHPTDCDWGTVDATAYAPSVDSALPKNAQALAAIFETNFSESILVIDAEAGNQLRIEVLTRFTDQSRRSAYSAVYAFSR